MRIINIINSGGHGLIFVPQIWAALVSFRESFVIPQTKSKKLSQKAKRVQRAMNNAQKKAS